MHESSSLSNAPPVLFCSYALEDETFSKKLEDHLSLLRRREVMIDYHSRKIAPGANWQQTLDNYLNSASIVLLLVSEHYFASDYCYGIEMQRALERHKAGLTRVIPILVSPVDWHEAPFAHLSPLPRNQIPVESWANQDEAFKEIVSAIRVELTHPAGLPISDPIKEPHEEKRAGVAEAKELPPAQAPLFPQPIPPRLEQGPSFWLHIRRKSLLLVFAILLLVGTVGDSSWQSPLVDATTFGFDAQHSHFNRVEKDLTASNVQHLSLYRAFSTHGQISSSPAVVHNIAYVGSHDKHLYAFDIATGKKLWDTATTGEILASPTVVNNTVYIASGTKLYALNAQNGNISWYGEMSDAIFSSPAVVNNHVYVALRGGIISIFAASGCGELKCPALLATPVDAHEPTTINLSSPAIAHGRMYIGVAYPDKHGEALCAFTLTGQSLWKTPLYFFQDADPYTLGNSSPSIDDDGNLVYMGFADGKLRSFATNDGRLRDTMTTNGRINSSPAIANKTVYIGSDDGGLYAFSTMTGELQWRALKDVTVQSSPFIAGSVVYVGSNDQRLYAFDASGCGFPECPPLWRYKTEGAIESSPTVVNGQVVVGSDDKDLYVFHLT